MIKNLLFDLGGVIINLNRARAVQRFEAIGLKDADKILGEYAQQGPFGALESGAISVGEFHQRMSDLIPGGASAEAIDSAFLAFLDTIPTARLEALQRLRKHFGIYLLSNTNILMWNTEIRNQFRQNGLDTEDYFDGIVTSFEARVMKPSPEIFRYAETKLNIRPDETLFLDDSELNCRAAADEGWHTLHVTPDKEFTELLRDYFEHNPQ